MGTEQSTRTLGWSDAGYNFFKISIQYYSRDLYWNNFQILKIFQMGTNQSTRTMGWSDAGYNMRSRLPSKSSQPFDSLEK
jgi:hypothetical protein